MSPESFHRCRQRRPQVLAYPESRKTPPANFAGLVQHIDRHAAAAQAASSATVMVGSRRVQSARSRVTWCVRMSAKHFGIAERGFLVVLAGDAPGRREVNKHRAARQPVRLPPGPVPRLPGSGASASPGDAAGGGGMPAS
jgi:hypothetical protein